MFRKFHDFFVIIYHNIGLFEYEVSLKYLYPLQNYHYLNLKWWHKKVNSEQLCNGCRYFDKTIYSSADFPIYETPYPICSGHHCIYSHSQEQKRIVIVKKNGLDLGIIWGPRIKITKLQKNPNFILQRKYYLRFSTLWGKDKN